MEAEVEEVAVVDDQDAAAEVETEPAAVAEDEAVDKVEDETTDKMAQPTLEDHQGIVGRMATAPIIATKEDLAMFLHATMYSPVPSAFLRAIERAHFKSWPGLTTSLVTKHLTKSLATLAKAISERNKRTYSQRK